MPSAPLLAHEAAALVKANSGRARAFRHVRLACLQCSETRRPSVPAFWQASKQAFFVAGHLLPIKFRFARPSPMHHQLQFQGSAQCSPAWYGQEAIALPEDFLFAGKSRMPWFAALNVSRIRTDSAQSLRPSMLAELAEIQFCEWCYRAYRHGVHGSTPVPTTSCAMALVCQIIRMRRRL